MTTPMRDPLPYPHRRGEAYDRNLPAACQVPESDHVNQYYSRDCPGCRIALMARALRDPHGHIITTETGRRINRVARVRGTTDELDPARVLFERTLAERYG